MCSWLRSRCSAATKICPQQGIRHPIWVDMGRLEVGPICERRSGPYQPPMHVTATWAVGWWVMSDDDVETFLFCCSNLLGDKDKDKKGFWVHHLFFFLFFIGSLCVQCFMFVGVLDFRRTKPDFSCFSALMVSFVNYRFEHKTQNFRIENITKKRLNISCFIFAIMFIFKYRIWIIYYICLDNFFFVKYE